MSESTHRGTIALERAEILAHTSWPGNQYVLRLRAPSVAARARPGTFVHLQCGEELRLRRPLSIMRAHDNDWIEVLYKPIGAGLAALAEQAVGDTLSVLGPIGNGFTIGAQVRRVLTLGGGVGIPPMVFAAQQLRDRDDLSLTVFMGSEIPFPMELSPRRLPLAGLDAGDSLAVSLLETWGVPSVLTSKAGVAGALDGYVTEPAGELLATLTRQELSETLVLACGPEPMLAAAAALARRFDVACQLALEEYMACGVGGCAGCTVEVHSDDGIAMKRVCVDGPVFEAAAIYPAA